MTIDTAIHDLRGGRDFSRDERGQISMLVLFSLIPVVFLIALVFNTAHQTVQKVQLQGAADAGAVSGSVWMARGMNLTVLNNNGMAEVLSVMITVRALHYTVLLTNVRVIPPLLPFIEIPAIAAYIELLEFLEETLDTVDSVLSNTSGGVGWQIMKAMDGLNQVIKTVIPPIIQLQAINYARQNGADKLRFVISGARGISFDDFLPMMPLARGGTKHIVERAEDCQLPKVKGAAQYVLIVYGFEPLAVATYNLLIMQNVAALKNPRLAVPVPPPLRWPNNPPRPMLLTDRPSRDAAATTSIPEEYVDLRKVRRFLQLLMIASGTRRRESSIGGDRFPNETPVWLSEAQFTYAQGDVYNPTHWDMFTQDWRAKLSKSSAFEEKKDALAKRLGIGSLNRYIDWSYINTH